ncbi:unnamed protein product [Arctia plantaginis]|uniref:Uncharacterized protein n=1 Tax=Arctia plantaginis TaxID=874455 RepID=A0A8S0YTU4_ARCPL|nr:unnamed protein product [Arctia plantaginis]CAB3247979.1 unnamed protein product [Arctia plantaginis]
MKIHILLMYDKSHIRTNKSLQSVFKLVPNLMKDDIFAKNALWWYRAYLTDDGRLFLKLPNVYNRWKEIQTNHFCVEMKGNKTRPVFMVEYEIDQLRNPSTYKKWALVVSVICLSMALVVYSVVRELRDLNGVILMIQLCCLIVTFITNCILESFNTMTLRMSEILYVSFFHYFFKVSSFSWTNILFYRLLMTSYRSKELPVSWTKQLTKYSAYAFGLPFFMTILTATIELSDMTDTPSFVTPQVQNRGNFSFQEMESLYYLYFPLLVLLSFNWIVCFAKVIEFCKKSKQFRPVVGTHPVDDELNRPMQFVKLNTLLTAYALVEMLTVIFLKGQPLGSDSTKAEMCADVRSGDEERYFSARVYSPKLCGAAYWLDWSGDVCWLGRRCALVRAELSCVLLRDGFF